MVVLRFGKGTNQPFRKKTIANKILCFFVKFMDSMEQTYTYLRGKIFAFKAYISKNKS